VSKLNETCDIVLVLVDAYLFAIILGK